MTDRFACSRASRARDEPCFATASQVRRWVLLEERGPWGSDALADSPLGAGVAAALRARARAVRARVLLIRRHGRYEPVGRACYLAVTRPGVHRVERFDLGHPAEALDLDWTPMADDEPTGGAPVDAPLFLVCTNGRHDTCCAEYGRPLAKALTAAFGDQVWECSHFGGDRFAGNLVCLPDGLYFGRVEPPDGPRIAAAYARGEVDLAHYRGRSSQPFVVQAAEYFARRKEGLLGVRDLALQLREDEEAGIVRVTFADRDNRRIVVTVEVSDAPDAVALTCSATVLLRPPRYRLITIES